MKVTVTCCGKVEYDDGINGSHFYKCYKCGDTVNIYYGQDLDDLDNKENEEDEEISEEEFESKIEQK